MFFFKFNCLYYDKLQDDFYHDIKRILIKCFFDRVKHFCQIKPIDIKSFCKVIIDIYWYYLFEYKQSGFGRLLLKLLGY